VVEFDPLSIKDVAKQLPDFKKVRSMLQCLVQDRGHLLALSPKYHAELAGQGVEYSAFWRPDATMAPLRGPVNLELGLKSHHTRNKSKMLLFFVFLFMSTGLTHRILPFEMNNQQGSSIPSYTTPKRSHLLICLILAKRAHFTVYWIQ
jgi:hypothetical protein